MTKTDTSIKSICPPILTEGGIVLASWMNQDGGTYLNEGKLKMFTVKCISEVQENIIAVAEFQTEQACVKCTLHHMTQKWCWWLVFY